VAGGAGQALRVVVLDDYQGVAAELGDWDQVGDDLDLVCVLDHLDGDDELAEALAGAQVVVAMRERTAISADLLARLPDLELLITTGLGNAVVDIEAAARQGVTVCGTYGTITPTSELTWGLILSLARHIPAEHQRVRDGGWQATIGTGLAGRTLGVVGLGNLGKLVAEVAKAFKMHVVAWSENLTADRAEAAGVELVGKQELFERSDVVSVHLVLSDRTRGLVGRDELRAMKPTAFLVNTSRGPIVDEAALLEALDQGWIAGAGLDVFATEPLPVEHPLRRAPNVVLTPHIGYVTDDCYRVFFDHIVEDVVAWRAGEPVRVLAAPTR
jgi:phosphoglycerate dehydrogenase-like enzyme